MSQYNNTSTNTFGKPCNNKMFCWYGLIAKCHIYVEETATQTCFLAVWNAYSSMIARMQGQLKTGLHEWGQPSRLYCVVNF